MLQFMGSQRVRHDWATELNWSAHWKPIQGIGKVTPTSSQEWLNTTDSICLLLLFFFFNLPVFKLHINEITHYVLWGRLLTLHIIFVKAFHLLNRATVHSLLILSSILFYKYNFNLLKNILVPLKGNCVISSLGLLLKTLLCTSLYIFFGAHVHTFLLSISGVELLITGHTYVQPW